MSTEQKRCWPRRWLNLILPRYQLRRNGIHPPAKTLLRWDGPGEAKAPNSERFQLRSSLHRASAERRPNHLNLVENQPSDPKLQVRRLRRDGLEVGCQSNSSRVFALTSLPDAVLAWTDSSVFTVCAIYGFHCKQPILWSGA
jgi:hypothetical protein